MCLKGNAKGVVLTFTIVKYVQRYIARLVIRDVLDFCGIIVVNKLFLYKGCSKTCFMKF